MVGWGVAVEMDPLSLLCRLAASVPPPRFHTVRYSGVIASASKLRSRVVPKPEASLVVAPDAEGDEVKKGGCRYMPWAELMMKTFRVDVLESPRCQGRLKVLAVVTELGEVRRFLKGLSVASALPELACLTSITISLRVASRTNATAVLTANRTETAAPDPSAI